MAMNNLPVVPGSLSVEWAATVATNTSRANISGTGTNTALTATSTNGKRIDEIVVQLAATSAAAVVFIWYYDGTNQYLYDEIYIPAITASTTVPAARVSKKYTNLYIQPTHRLFASTTIAQNTNVGAFGGAY